MNGLLDALLSGVSGSCLSSSANRSLPLVANGGVQFLSAKVLRSTALWPRSHQAFFGLDRGACKLRAWRSAHCSGYCSLGALACATACAEYSWNMLELVMQLLSLLTMLCCVL